MLQNAERSAAPHIWNFPSFHKTVTSRLVQTCQVPEPIVEILYQRGYTTQKEIEQFLSPEQYEHPSPWQLTDMERAVDRIVKAIQKEETIVVYGDYDVDGQASTALVVDALRRAGANVSYYIPHRIDDGYGLSEHIIKQLAPTTDLIITVDCGITSQREVELARQHGCDTIITDHHEAGHVLPQAVAVVNPKRADCDYPDKRLAGCGVAHKLITALYEVLEYDREQLNEWLDLVALATIADVVPLQGENRAFVAKGLTRFSRRTGLQTLCQIAGVDVQQPTAGQVAFSIAPRLNAAGRLAEAGLGVELLLTDDSVQAQYIATTLNDYNERRRQIEDDIVHEAQQWVEQNVDLNEARGLVVVGEGWHPGVIGIVASRLVELYHRPTIVFSVTNGEATGSGRSIHSFDLFSSLQQLATYFDRFGGHSMAAGITLRSQRLEEFRHEFLGLTKERLSPVDLIPRLRIDSVIPFERIDDDLCQALQRMAPFGFGNPEPTVMIQNAQLTTSERVGRDQSHWRCVLQDASSEKQIQGIGFRLAEAFGTTLHVGDTVDVVGSLQNNEWRGRKHIQVQIRDARPRCQVTQHVQMAVHSLNGSSSPGEATQNRKQTYGPLTMKHNGKTAAVQLYDWRDDTADATDTLRHSLAAAKRTSEQIIVWSTPYDRPTMSRLRDTDTENNKTSVYVCTGQLMENRQMPGKTALIFGSLPDHMEHMRHIVERAMTWGTELDIHFTFTAQQVQQAIAQQNRVIPDVDTLRAMYVYMRQTIRTEQPTSVDVRGLMQQLSAKGISITPAGILYAWRVFSETALMNWEKTKEHQYEITMHPTGRHKVDLTTSVRYNEGELKRQQFQQFAHELITHSGQHILQLINTAT